MKNCKLKWCIDTKYFCAGGTYHIISAICDEGWILVYEIGECSKYIVAAIKDKEDISTVSIDVRSCISNLSVFANIRSANFISYIEQLDGIVDRLAGQLIAYEIDINCEWQKIPMCGFFSTCGYSIGSMLPVSPASYGGIYFRLDKHDYGFYIIDINSIHKYEVHLNGYREYQYGALQEMTKITEILCEIDNLIESHKVMDDKLYSVSRTKNANRLSEVDTPINPSASTSLG